MDNSVTSQLAELLAVYDTPITQMELITDWKEYQNLHGLGREDIGKRELKDFLVSLTAEMLHAVNVTFITTLARDVVMKVSQRKALDQKKIKLDKDPISEEVRVVMAYLYQELAKLIALREECLHYINVLKHATVCLKTFNNAVNVFLTESVEEYVAFEAKEANKIKSFLNTDIKSYSDIVTVNTQQLSLSIEALKTNTYYIYRVDSAIRLLGGFKDTYNLVNKFQSKNDTDPLPKGKDNDFCLEK